jgi:hypothetical protein
MVDEIPFDRRHVDAKLRAMEDDVRNLREKVEKSEDVVSVGRAAAPLFVDYIERIMVFSHQLDEALGGRLVLEGLSLRDNFRRADFALWIFARLTSLFNEATEGLLACFGVSAAILIQGQLGWDRPCPTQTGRRHCH